VDMDIDMMNEEGKVAKPSSKKRSRLELIQE
jgi:hypothetical protein